MYAGHASMLDLMDDDTTYDNLPWPWQTQEEQEKTSPVPTIQRQPEKKAPESQNHAIGWSSFLLPFSILYHQNEIKKTKEKMD